MLAALTLAVAIDCTPSVRHTVPRIVAKAHKAQPHGPVKRHGHKRKAHKRAAPALCYEPHSPLPAAVDVPEVEPFPPLDFAAEPEAQVAQATPDAEYVDDRAPNPSLPYLPWYPTNPPGQATVPMHVPEPDGWAMAALLGGAALVSIIIRRGPRL